MGESAICWWTFWVSYSSFASRMHPFKIAREQFPFSRKHIENIQRSSVCGSIEQSGYFSCNDIVDASTLDDIRRRPK